MLMLPPARFLGCIGCPVYPIDFGLAVAGAGGSSRETSPIQPRSGPRLSQTIRSTPLAVPFTDRGRTRYWLLAVSEHALETGIGQVRGVLPANSAPSSPSAHVALMMGASSLRMR